VEHFEETISPQYSTSPGSIQGEASIEIRYQNDVTRVTDYTISAGPPDPVTYTYNSKVTTVIYYFFTDKKFGYDEEPAEVCIEYIQSGEKGSWINVTSSGRSPSGVHCESNAGNTTFKIKIDGNVILEDETITSSTLMTYPVTYYSGEALQIVAKAESDASDVAFAEYEAQGGNNNPAAEGSAVVPISGSFVGAWSASGDETWQENNTGNYGSYTVERLSNNVFGLVKVETLRDGKYYISQYTGQLFCLNYPPFAVNDQPWVNKYWEEDMVGDNPRTGDYDIFPQNYSWNPRTGELAVSQSSEEYVQWV
jgi:hypothetical protein